MAQRYFSARNAAFHRQDGRCFYCEFPMWLTDLAGFAAAHGLTLRQASRLQATGEHLVAQQDGGRHGANVVAACHHCNQARHRFRPHAAPDPDRFQARVRSRVKHRHWHPRAMFHVLAR
jgi:5-methylcytosine-specific restriction endonuclease McrA